MILALFIFFIAFLAIYSQPKKKVCVQPYCKLCAFVHPKLIKIPSL
jgi:hypothetical protein